MKRIRHGPLEFFSIIFKTKGHILVGESSPQENKIYFVMIFLFDLNFTIVGETIHEGKDLTSNTFINDLINEWFQVIVLWTRCV